MSAATKIPAQRERQSSEHRESGRYAKVNPCQRCGKSAGVNYYSDHRVDVEEGFDSVAIVLCKRCATKGESLPSAEALAYYVGGE